MDLQRIPHLLLSRALNFITRLALHKPAAFAFQPLSAPHKRLLLISSVSLSLALTLAWMVAGLPRPDGLRHAFAAGSTRYVATTGVDGLNNCSVAILPCLTVQHAADQSMAGDEIRIAGGAYSGVSVRDTVTQVVYISQSLTLRGGYTTTDSFATSDPNLSPTILDAELNNARVMFITGTSATSDIENLTIQNGKISGSGFDCPDAGCGGGLFVNGTLSLTNVTVMSSTAFTDGGGAWVGGAAILSSGMFQNNTASGIIGRGGGLFVQGVLALTGTQFLSNTASRYGGGAFANGATTLDRGLFLNNLAIEYGGGGGLFANSTLMLTGTQFLSNTAGYACSGAGAYANGAATLNIGLFQNNTASNSGGGAWVGGAATLNGGLFQNNTASGADGGGGLYSNGTLALTGTQFLSNTAYGSGGVGGGGVLVSDAATLNGGLFQNNTDSTGNGGGLWAYNTLALTGTRFLSNTTGYSGGGLWAISTLTLTDTQFLGNTAGGNGGGLYLIGGSGGRIVNSLFARNSAATTIGAALALYSTGTVQILHTTIASTIVGNGSAIYIAYGTVGITDTIVASYTTGITVAAGTAYENYNLFFGNGTNHVGTTGGTNDVLNGDPRFINPMSDDYHFNVGSAAIDWGTNVGVTTDIDGDVRPFGAGYDIGYDEWIGELLYLPLVRQ
jgi:hypothetical protein